MRAEVRREFIELQFFQPPFHIYNLNDSLAFTHDVQGHRKTKRLAWKEIFFSNKSME